MLNVLNAPPLAGRDATMPRRDAPLERWTIRALISTLLRRMEIVAVAIAACVAIAFLYLMLAEPRFTATATLIPDTRRAPPAPNEIAPEVPSDPAIVENQIEIIRSERIALMVIDRLELWKDPEFVGTGPGLMSRAMIALGLRTPRDPDQEILRRAAAGGFRTMLKVARVGRSHLTEIAFTSKDAEKAATIANEVADAYIRDQLNAKFSQAERSTRWMRQRIAELEREAASAARAVAEYKARHNLDGEAGGTPAVVREQEELAASLDQARAETARVDTPKQDLEAARLREAAIVRRINDIAPRVAEMRGHLDTLGELEARVASFRRLHEALQNRYARVSQFLQQQSLPVTEARVIAEATPPLRKSSPKALLLLLLAAAAGGTVGIGGAFAAEYFDRRVRRPGQIEEDLGLRPLGIVPRFSMPTGKEAGNGAPPRLPPGIDRWLAGAAGETLRGVRIAVDGSARPSGARILGIVSPNAGEGKTTVALALAIIAARGGRRTLLIDGDIREPSLTRALTPGAPGGLAAALEQAPPFADAVTPHPLGFDFLGQAPGYTRLHPSDLLASVAMQDMLEHLRSRYDTIIVDTPAMLAHVDVAAAAGLFDAFVMIAAWGKTTLDDIGHSVVSSAAFAERLTGVLINKGPAA